MRYSAVHAVGRDGVAGVAAVGELGVDDVGNAARGSAAAPAATLPLDEIDVVTNSAPSPGRLADAGEVDVAGEHDEPLGRRRAAASSRSRAGA